MLIVCKPDRTDRFDQELATSSVLKKPLKLVKNQVELKTGGKKGFVWFLKPYLKVKIQENVKYL